MLLLVLPICITFSIPAQAVQYYSKIRNDFVDPISEYGASTQVELYDYQAPDRHSLRNISEKRRKNEHSKMTSYKSLSGVTPISRHQLQGPPQSIQQPFQPYGSSGIYQPSIPTPARINYSAVSLLGLLAVMSTIQAAMQDIDSFIMNSQQSQNQINFETGTSMGTIRPPRPRPTPRPVRPTFPSGGGIGGGTQRPVTSRPATPSMSPQPPSNVGRRKSVLNGIR